MKSAFTSATCVEMVEAEMGAELATSAVLLGDGLLGVHSYFVLE